ncbi:MAG: ATP-dependent DNA helicase RecG [Solirubrobacterales bacterium]
MERSPLAFADSRELSADELAAWPRLGPRPSAMAEPVDFPGRKAREAAGHLGIETVGELLELLPRDNRESRTVDALVPGEPATVVVEVRSISSRPVRRRGMRPLVEAVVGDDTGVMQVTFFNQPWLAKRYPPGTRLVLHGSYESRNRFRVSSHAPTSEAFADDGEVAHYPAADGLSSTQILALVREHLGAALHAPEPLPGRMRAGHMLPDRAAALIAAHGGEVVEARRRLAFDELLFMQLDLLRRRATRAERLRAPVLDGEGPHAGLLARWLADQLPFTPTGGQQEAIATIVDDMEAGHPMQRLLMGEVGSGKTVVALAAMLRAVESGHQAALMAPTETLAEQHFATIQQLVAAEPISIALLTGSTPAARRAEILERLESGELGMVVGTHALIEDDVRFARLALAVVDEQHRFGVRQRMALDAKAAGEGEGMAPHVLHMTATPIPRTLALLGYGDLDFTELRELPAGRQPVATHCVSGERERERAYERIREELDAGRQAFIVCPLVEESDALQARAATAEYERLREEEFGGYRVALLHGQMSSADKAEAMRSFAEGEADVLVATTVIEVGVDVPNATVMLIENAERFGLSQLHQLRGRVGRGEHASLCICFGPADSERLKAFAEHADGFRLAEIDLQLRGEGELAGTRQSGSASFRFARFPEDAPLLERARHSARELLAADPELASPEGKVLSDALAEGASRLPAEAIPA